MPTFFTAPARVVTQPPWRRPLPGPEPFPAVGWPPTNTANVTGNQGTTQYRPDTQSDTKFNLGHPALDANHAFWTQAPGTVVPAVGGPVYPMVINQGGGAGNGTKTWHYGGRIVGTDAENTPRDVQYADHTSGIEHTGNDLAGYLVGDSLRVSGIGDAYRFVDKGTAYLKRFWASNIRDGFVEFDELDGDAFIFDCLVEGCYSGFSHSGPPAHDATARTLTIDGVLMWLKPTVDTPSTSGGVWHGGGAGQAELDGVWSDGRFRGSNGIWEGDAISYGKVIVRNSVFRIDRPSVYNNPAMLWPGQSGALWNNNAKLEVHNTTICWTGASKTLDAAGQIVPGNASYPSTVPPGVALVTGRDAFDMWNQFTQEWKTAHGY